MRADEIICIVMHLPQKSILRLKLSRKVFSLHQRRILPLKLPFYPLLPCLSRVNHRINKFLLFLFEEVRDLADFFPQNQSLQHDLIVHISIRIFFTQLEVGIGILYLLLLLKRQLIVYNLTDIVESRQNGVLYDSQSNFGDMS